MSKKLNRKSHFERIAPEYKELLQSFMSVLNVTGRSFGQRNNSYFGLSDGNEGIQWNISISKDTGIIRFGVNLEGKKYRNWPISTFILSELDSCSIREIRYLLKSPENVHIRFSRDAWQAVSRPNIIEKFIGGREISFAEIDPDKWVLMLSEALDCLNQKAHYCGRAKQTVTFENKQT